MDQTKSTFREKEKKYKQELKKKYPQVILKLKSPTVSNEFVTGPAKTFINKAEYQSMCNRFLAFCKKKSSLPSDPSNFKVLPEKSTFYEITAQSTPNI